MSEAFLNKVTLDYLMNKDQYKKQITNKLSHNIANVINEKEKQFYRKRIYHLVKELLLEKKEISDISQDVKNDFNTFINTCIHYFKIIDNNDIIQQDIIQQQDEPDKIEESCNIVDNTKKINITENPDNKEADQLIMRKVKKHKTSLDDFVKRTVNHKHKEIILPKQKDINLYDPELKNKGIKNKNISIEYEDIKTKKTHDKPNDETAI